MNKEKYESANWNAKKGEYEDINIIAEREPRLKAMIPFFIFVIFYLGLSLWANDFYKVPMPIAFLVASASALFLNHKIKLMTRVEIFAKGMGDVNVMLMCLIFILAGIFASVTKNMGAVDAAVFIVQKFIPADFMLAGLFLVSCLISLAIGTSCGTIAALTPIAADLVAPLGVSPALVIGAVIGGAMFGDNMSMISDTTIAATRTQNVDMRDKFIQNFKMVLPAAALSILIYLIMGHGCGKSLAPAGELTMMHLLLVTPYILLLVLSLLGFNVMALLFFGSILACAMGIFTGKIELWTALDCCGKGTLDMAETLIVAILAGGLLKVIRWNGGVSFILRSVEKLVKSERGCEFGVFFLVSAINLFTANNTVAIVIAGPIAADLSTKFGCSPKRIASILDTASCFIQGILPYGAQILIAVGAAKAASLNVSALSLFSGTYYPWIMAAIVLLCIGFRPRKKHS